MTDVQVIRSLEEWGRLREPWQRLLDESGNRSPFMTWEWLDAWLREFAEGRELQVLACREGDEIAAVVPLAATVHRDRKVEVRTARLVGNGLSDRLDVLVRPGREDALAAIAQLLASGEIRWDVIELADLDGASEAARAFAAALSGAGISARLEPSVECPYLPVASDWETFYSTRVGKKTRTTNRVKLRKLAAMGDLRFRWVVAPEDVAPALEAVRGMDERSAYQGAERRRPFDSESGERFFLDFGRRFAANGWLLLGLLELDGAVVAYRFGFRFQGRHFDYFPGFEPKLFKLSVGRLLMTEILQKCFEEGVEEVDFLRGFESWKQEWTDSSRPNAVLTATHPSLASRFRVWLQRLPGH